MSRRTHCNLALLTVLTLSACGGGGGGGGGDGGGGGTTVTVSGRITFDRVPFSGVPGSGLDFAGVVEAPAREVIVEALDGTTIRATTSTNASGEYSLQVPANSNIRMRAKAQMQKTGTAPTWNFRVLDNTNNDALYALDGEVFNVGTSDVTRNLRATSGWGATSYTETRAAAPFAILDTVYQARELLRSASGSQNFLPLDLYWSTQNRPQAPFCPDTGAIDGTRYVFGGEDSCSPSGPIPRGIYILGAVNSGVGDTDEFDQHVIAHEFGHYFEDAFSRVDSIGGPHGFGDRLDLRVAFSEGWGNAFSAMVLDDPVYRDSAFGFGDAHFNIESDSFGAAGWYNEASIHRILWDVFDTGTESGDDVALGFGPFFDVLSGGQRSTEALTSIFSFGTLLKSEQSGSAPAINSLLSAQSIVGVDMDEFGSTETNDAGNPAGDVLPVYTPVALNQAPVQVCGTALYGTFNKLSNRRFLTVDVPSAGSISITAAAGSDLVPPPDPDIILWRRGSIVDIGDNIGTTEILNVPAAQAGTHVIEVYEFSHIDPEATTRRGRTCMNVSVTG